MKNTMTDFGLALAFTAIAIATIAIVSPSKPHSMAIEQVDRTTNKWDNPAMPSPCELDPTLRGCGELIDVCQLDRTLMGCGDPDYK